MQDPNIIRKIVASLGIRPEDRVVEIGPGRGALTEHIIPLAGETHIIEFDRDLAEHWRQRALSEPRLHVHESDVLKFDFTDLIDGGRLKIIGNLPYNISSPVLFHLLPYAGHILQQVVMLQKEVVERMAAKPGNKQYGRLSVILQYRYEIENLFSVPPGAFFPPPKVESAIARLTPRANIEHPATSMSDLQLIVKNAFAQRRKTLRNTLKQSLTEAQIESSGVDPACRAETLTVQQFVALANTFSSSQ